MRPLARTPRTITLTWVHNLVATTKAGLATDGTATLIRVATLQPKHVGQSRDVKACVHQHGFHSARRPPARGVDAHVV